jgi:hypothetical protein
MSKNDGYELWRQKEAAKLSSIMQKRLRAMQNPKSCRKALKLFCFDNGHECGVGNIN